MKYFFKRCYDYWMAFAEILGIINGYMVFSVFFVVVLGPYALFLKLRSFLIHSHTPAWQPKESAQSSIEDLKHQF